MGILGKSFKASTGKKAKRVIGATMAFGALAGAGGYAAATASADPVSDMQSTANSFAQAHGYPGAGSYQIQGQVDYHGDSVDGVYAIPGNASSPKISVACDTSSCSINWTKLNPFS